MRMWLCSPKILCRKHLFGEHVEMHMFLGALKKGKKIRGYLDNNLFQPTSLYFRHEQLKREIISRGYNHKSPIDKKAILFFIKKLPHNDLMKEIDKKAALKELLSRCPSCRERFQKNGFGEKGEEIL